MSITDREARDGSASVDPDRLREAFAEADLSLESWERVADLETPYDRLVYLTEPGGVVSIEVFIARHRPDMDYEAFKLWCRTVYRGPLGRHDDFVPLYREYVEDWLGRARIEADWVEGDILCRLEDAVEVLEGFGYAFEQVHDHRHRIRVIDEPHRVGSVGPLGEDVRLTDAEPASDTPGTGMARDS